MNGCLPFALVRLRINSFEQFFCAKLRLKNCLINKNMLLCDKSLFKYNIKLSYTI
jgi:hypothetical protein